MSSDPVHTKNKKSLTPKLRFKEFFEGWSLQTLSDVINVIDCKHRTPEYVEEGVPVVSPGTIKWGEIDLITPTKRVTYEDYKSLMDHCSPKKGDLVFSRNQSIGIASLVVNGKEFVLGQDTVLMQSIGIDSRFSYYTLQGEYVQGQISRLSGGSTFSRINLGDIRKLKLRITLNENEQQKIASFLIAVDEKIQQLTRKKELLEQYKKGAMQQLFSGKLRFKDENGKAYPKWEEKLFDECIQTISTRSHQVKSNEILKVGKYPVVDQGQSMVAGYSDRTECLFTNQPVIVFGDHTTILKYVDFDFIVGADGTKLLACSAGINLKYIYYYLSFNNAEQEGYKRHFSILREVTIKLPAKEEQQRIANFLSAIDSKLGSVSAQIEQAQNFKKGLLQQMFV